MLISVYMSVKNGMPLVQDAVSSLLGQSYQNWELVVVDDGSTDDTPAFLDEIASRNDNIKVMKTAGVGRSQALNMAIALTQGEIVANLDADDLFHPDKLAIQSEVFTRNKVDIVCTGILILQGGGYPDEFKRGEPFLGGELPPLVDVTRGLMVTNPVNHSSVAFRRSLLASGMTYDESLRWLVDYDLWARMARAGQKFIQVRYPLVAKRIHAGQSYENKQRYGYLLKDFSLRRALISDMGGGVRYHAMNSLKLLYGCLPQRLRMVVRPRINAIGRH